MGFAAILLGLAVTTRRAVTRKRCASELSIPEVRRAIAPSIFLAAVTTIAAFRAQLRRAAWPGATRSLVGVGVALCARDIFAFLPPLFQIG